MYTVLLILVVVICADGLLLVLCVVTGVVDCVTVVVPCLLMCLGVCSFVSDSATCCFSMAAE